MNHSAALAGLLVEELGREIALLATRPHRFAGFVVLKAPDVPSVLIELGYLSNPEEERRLTSPQYRIKVARGLMRAVDRYFARNASAAG
jgi:N-acetylmuramoyl-L-alanine amidase